MATKPPPRSTAPAPTAVIGSQAGEVGWAASVWTTSGRSGEVDGDGAVVDGVGSGVPVGSGVSVGSVGLSSSTAVNQSMRASSSLVSASSVHFRARLVPLSVVR